MVSPVLDVRVGGFKKALRQIRERNSRGRDD
jgi:hypothetical protein